MTFLLKKTSTPLLLLLLLQGCHSTTSLPLYDTTYKPTPKILQQMEPTFPKEFTASQRVVLTVRGKEYDFIGYLAMSASGDYRVQGYGEMGGKFFDFLRTKKETKILKKPELLPLNPLLDGVQGDINHVYRALASIDDLFFAPPTQTHQRLILKKNQKDYNEFIFSLSREEFVESQEIKDDSPIRKVTYHEYKTFPGWNKPIPTKIVIQNFRWNYTLTISTLSLKARKVNNKVFLQQ